MACQRSPMCSNGQSCPKTQVLDYPLEVVDDTGEHFTRRPHLCINHKLDATRRNACSCKGLASLVPAADAIVRSHGSIYLNDRADCTILQVAARFPAKVAAWNEPAQYFHNASYTTDAYAFDSPHTGIRDA